MMTGITTGWLAVTLAFSGLGSCEVLLINSLINETASFGDTVNFTCTTIGSNTLAWSSPEYIGQNGEQLSLSPLGTTSILNTYVFATVISTNIENGQRVLESNLTIIVQGTIPTASVKCSSLGTGESSMTSFQLAKNPMIECENLVVCPGNVRTFTCETRGSTSLIWESAEYIGGNPISFTPLSPLGIRMNSDVNPDVTASLMMNYEINGVRVLMSQLIITVSEDIKDDMRHMIICVNVGLGVSDNRTLHMAQDGSCASQESTESEITRSESSNAPNEICSLANCTSNNQSSDDTTIIVIVIVMCTTAGMAVAHLGIICLLLLVKKNGYKNSIHSSAHFEKPYKSKNMSYIT